MMVKHKIRFSITGIILVGVLLSAFLLFQRYPYTDTKPMVIKVKSDMRDMAIAIEQYKLNYGEYPNPILTDAKIPQSTHSYNMILNLEELGIKPYTVDRPWFVWENYEGPSDYKDWLAHIPRPYLYYTDGVGWMLISTGPDGDYDMNFQKNYDSSVPQPTELLIAFGGYDPTNGTNSDGDVYRVKQ